MSTVQVSLDQVLPALKRSLHSIDLRAAIVRTDKPDSIITVIRISPRPMLAVQERHATLLKNLGRGEATSFKILYDVLPFARLDEVLVELAAGTLTVAGNTIHLRERIISNKLRGDIHRHHHAVRPWSTVAPPAFYSYLQFGLRGHSFDGLTADVRQAFGARSVGESTDAFLELKDSGQELGKFLIHVEMPARIASVLLAGSTIRTQIEAVKTFSPLRLCVNRYDVGGARLLESRFPDFKVVQEADPFVLFDTEAVFSSMQDSDTISCVLTQDQLPEIDEVTKRARELMEAEEKNPLLESLRKFWDINKLYEQAVQPFLTKRTKVDVRPQDVFQKAIARLLNLAGFQVIDLERQDRIYHAETKVERATVDVLAYHPGERILLLGACTIGVPKTEDYEKLLHAREIFKASLTPEIPLYIAPVLFTMQENVSPFRTDMAAAGLHMLNTRDLEVLTKLIDVGKEAKFIYFLKSPIPTALADMT